MLSREHVISDVLTHLHNNNDNAHKLFFTSSQNSTFFLMEVISEVIFEAHILNIVLRDGTSTVKNKIYFY